MGCHGENGTGAIAVSLVGVTKKFPTPQLIALLHSPNAKMRAGGMPAVDISASDMSALLKYLSVLGTSAANVPTTTGGAAPSPSAAAPSASATTKKSLTPDTPSGVPTTSAEPAAAATGASAAVVEAGGKIFQSHACAACHGPAGAGTARVPPLAGLVAGLSDQQLSTLLHHPNAKMRAGGMPAFVGPPDQETSLITYIHSLVPAKQAKAKPEHTKTAAPAEQTATASSTPVPAPPAAAKSTPTAQPSPSAAGRAIFVANGCAACHGQQGTGTHFAPSLVGITGKFPGTKLPYLLHHPTSKMRDGGMPVVNVHGEDMQHLMAYLGNLGMTPAGVDAIVANAGVRATPAQTTQTRVSLNGNSAAALGGTQPASVPPLSADALRGKQIFHRNRCETCHGIGGLHGTVAAPPLAGTASILPASVLESLLRHHSIQMQKGGMPLTNMNARNMKDLVAYIRSMPNPNQGQ